MYKRLTILTVVLLVVALFLAAFEGPPNRDRPLVTFVGKETCKVTDPGKVEDKDAVTKTIDKLMTCYDETDNPSFTGPVELTLHEAWDNPKANHAGWGWYEFKLKGQGTTWEGFRLTTTHDGATYTRGWGYATNGELRNKVAYWQFSNENPAVIKGWYDAPHEDE